MDKDVTKSSLQKFCDEANDIVRVNALDVRSFHRLSPLNDPTRNKPFQDLPSFSAVVKELALIPEVLAQFGPDSVQNLALQFLYNYFGLLSNPVFDLDAFERTWADLLEELETEEWTYAAIANLQNFNSDETVLHMGDDISIRVRSYDEIAKILRCTHDDIDATLGDDWLRGSVGSHVVIARTKVKKNPDNLVLASDISAIAKIDRIILSLRLSKAGDIRAGRIFYFRPAYFHYGLRGISSAAYSIWNPGPQYSLGASEVDDVIRHYELLLKLKTRSDRYVRALNLAVRSFTSLYDRRLHEREDRILDGIIAAEALLHLDTELSFKCAFRVAALLAWDDESRVRIFKDMRTAYETRSTIVHGSELKRKHIDMLNNLEPLEGYIRQMLVGFIRLAVEGKLNQDFYDSLDITLLHAERRSHLRSSLGFK